MKSAGILWYNPRNEVAEKQVITRLCRQYPSRHGEPCSGLTSITIPDSVTFIGDDTFYGCSSLISITIPDGVTSIGYAAFCGCSSLISITIPDSVTSIGMFAFNGCTSLTDVYYGGSEDDWNAIDIGDYNDPLLSANIHYAGYLPSLDGWGFSHDDAIKSTGGTLSEKAFYSIFDKNSWINKIVYAEKKHSLKGGLCQELAVGSALTYLGYPSVTEWKENAESAAELTAGNLDNASDNYGLTLSEYIQALWAYQYSHAATVEEDSHKSKSSEEYRAVIDAVDNFYETQENPIAILIRDWEGTLKYGGHVLIPYRTEEEDGQIRVYVYDCNYGTDDGRYITFTSDEAGKLTAWSYMLSDTLEFSSDSGKMTYYSNLTNLADIMQISQTSLAGSADSLLVTNSVSFDALTDGGGSVGYYYGLVSGEENTGIYPVWETNLLMDGSDSTSSGAMFYLDSIASLTLQNNDDSGENVTTTLADDDSDVTIVSDGQSTVTLGETDAMFQVSVTPSASGRAAITYTTDFGDTVFEVSGTTDGTVSLSAESGSAEIRFSGYEAATVTVTRDGSTTTLDLGADTYTVAIQDDGTVIAESATTPGDLNGDGEVNASDLTILARHVGKVETIEDSTYLANADVTGDGEVDASDLTKLAQYVGKIISSLD